MKNGSAGPENEMTTSSPIATAVAGAMFVTDWKTR